MTAIVVLIKGGKGKSCEGNTDYVDRITPGFTKSLFGQSLMTEEHQSQEDDLLSRGINALRSQGFLFLPRWRADQNLLSVAQSIGIVLKMPDHLPNSDIPTVHNIRPHQKSEAQNNKYSAAFGLSEFPLHTDLAHWTLPPRYALIRCRSGSPRVLTELLHYEDAVQAIGEDAFGRAQFRARRPPGGRILRLLSMKLQSSSDLGMRWDSIFIKPMNDAAVKVADVMNAKDWQQRCARSVRLIHFGDTLLIDNWRCLHGRSRVPIDETHRCLERIYLSEITI